MTLTIYHIPPDRYTADVSTAEIYNVCHAGVQVSADLLPELLQLHDPRPLRGETQGCHQAALSGKLSLQARA